MTTRWEQYERQCEDAAIADVQGQLEKALVDLNRGRNLDCWPLCSFGGKDADLTEYGCTGISDIRYGEEELLVRVGGHKTVGGSDCLESEDEAICATFDEIAQEMVIGCGYHGEWTGDEWTLSFSDEVKVPWVLAEDESEDIKATAVAAVQAAEAAVKPFEDAMKTLSEDMDRLYEEINPNEEAK